MGKKRAELSGRTAGLKWQLREAIPTMVAIATLLAMALALSAGHKWK